ncbi:MAG: glutathione S-transferase family protein [Myxococcota bacterium]
MITLYQFATSPLCEKVRRILNYKGLPFEIHEVPRAKAAEYAHVSPTGKFPAIEDDGTAVWDSTDIAHHLEAKGGDRLLVPADPREAAMVHVLEDWADESLYFYEITMRVAWEHNASRVAEEFAATMPGMTAEAVLPLVTKAAQELTSKQGLGRKPQDQVVRDVERHIAALEGLLGGGDWLVGNTVSLADIAVLVELNALEYAQEAAERLTASVPVAAWRKRTSEIAPD